MTRMNREDVTEDALFDGRLKILQPRRGYRFALDAVLLAGLCRPGQNDEIADLGTGCGVIPLIMAFRGQGKFITGMEIQESLAKLAAENVKINKMEERIRIVHGDFREVEKYFPAEQTDLVICNPPYRKVKTGRINPNEEKALARHEILANLDDVLNAARYLLKTKGRLSIIYPATRLAHLCNRIMKYGFEPKRLTIIYSAPGEGAQLVYLDSRKGGGEELHIDPPFFVYDGKGNYSEEMKRLYEKNL